MTVALSLLGIPIPENLKGGELGTGNEPVLVGQLIGSENYSALELVQILNLDGIGMYPYLKHGGIQEEVDGHFMVAGGSIRSVADLDLFHFPEEIGVMRAIGYQRDMILRTFMLETSFVSLLG